MTLCRYRLLVLALYIVDVSHMTFLQGIINSRFCVYVFVNPRVNHVWFQASAAQRRISVFYRRFGKLFLGCLTLEDGTDGLSRNVGKKIQFYAAHNSTRAQISTCKSNDGFSWNLALTMCRYNPIPFLSLQFSVHTNTNIVGTRIYNMRGHLLHCRPQKFATFKTIIFLLLLRK